LALVNIVTAANPFVLVAVALVGLAAALVIAYQRSETFRKIVDAAFAGVSAAVSKAWNVIRPIFEALRQTLQGLINFVAGVFTGDWSRAWQGLQTAAMGGWKLFKTWVLTLPALLLGWGED